MLFWFSVVVLPLSKFVSTTAPPYGLADIAVGRTIIDKAVRSINPLPFIHIIRNFPLLNDE